VVKTPEEVKSLEAKLCETLLTLGEVSLESENYEQAVADITECLNMRKVKKHTTQGFYVSKCS
jgi:hypothetical protein